MEIWTILRMVQWGTEYFRKKRVDSPRLTIELLLAHVLGLKRFDLYMQFDRPLLEEELSPLRELVKRRAAGEPLQYVLGEAPFHGRTFLVRPGVLIPRPETEILVDEALRRTQALRCLDVGTGSGCIAITVAAERPGTEVTAIDISEQALKIARENALRLKAEHVDFHCIDFFDNARMSALGSFDLIISNPPYIAETEVAELQREVRDHEPRIAVTDGGDGMAFYRQFAQLAPSLLRREGELFLELGYNQATEVRKLFEQAGFEVDLYTDLDRIERILRARRPDTSASVL